jgi:hypothetical protein
MLMEVLLGKDEAYRRSLHKNKERNNLGEAGRDKAKSSLFSLFVLFYLFLFIFLFYLFFFF